MKFKREDIQAIADLARLSIAEEEFASYQEKLATILEYVQSLDQVKTDGVEEMAHAQEAVNVFREDVVESCDEETQSRLKDNFPRREGDLLSVNRAIPSTER